MKSFLTDEERDEIIDLVDRLPSEFFGENKNWVNTVKKLHNLVGILEKRKSEIDPKCYKIGGESC